MDRNTIELMAHMIIIIDENTGIKLAVPVVGVINEASVFEKRNVKFGNLEIRNVLIRMRNTYHLNGNCHPPYPYSNCILFTACWTKFYRWVFLITNFISFLLPVNTCISFQ